MSHKLDLSVKVWYLGHKAQSFFPNYKLGIKLLLADLVTLKLPHPKQENIRVIPLHNGVTECSFFWPDAVRDGVLHRHLQTRIYPSTVEGREALKGILSALDMSNLTLQEIVPSQSSNKPRPNRQRYSNDYIGRTHRSPVTEQQWDLSGLPAFVDHSSRSSENSSNLDEAQMLLDDVASTFRIPKQEPMEISIPPAIARYDSVASSVRSKHASPSPASSPVQTKFSLREVAPMILGSTTPTPIMQSSSVLPGTTTPPPTSPLALPIPHPTSFPPLGPPHTTKPNTPPGPQPPPYPQATYFPSSTTTGLKRSRSPLTSQHPSKRLVPNPRDDLQIEKLTSELWDLRNQITSGIARETVIINELRELNSAFVPEISTLPRANSDDRSNEEGGYSSVKARLEIVEQELKEEKKQRMWAEEMLKDIQRECREPFVVPALFDAFVMISKVTSQAMDPAL